MISFTKVRSAIGISSKPSDSNSDSSSKLVTDSSSVNIIVNVYFKLEFFEL